MIFFVHIFQSFTEVSARKKQLVQMEKDFDTSPFALLLTESQHLLVGDTYFTGYFSTKYLYNCFRVACQGVRWHKNASKSTNLDHMHTTLMI